MYKCNEFRTNKIQNNEIGVITPYRKQVEKIRKMLNSAKFEGVSVGSAEEFQGRACCVLIG
jgi:superfamily I DNA and/or RNA helicase